MGAFENELRRVSPDLVSLLDNHEDFPHATGDTLTEQGGDAAIVVRVSDGGRARYVPLSRDDVYYENEFDVVVLNLSDVQIPSV